MSNVIEFPAQRGNNTKQLPQRYGLPTAPVRYAILEAFLAEKSEHQIGKNLSMPTAIVREVLRGWQEIHRQQAAMTRLNKPEMQGLFRQIEIEVWRDVSRGPIFPPPVSVAERKAA